MAEGKGPAVTGSQEDGFGAGFVKRSIAYELNGTVEMSYEPSGFKAEIAFPLPGSSRGARS